jgi:hypothetical protein
MKFRSALEHFYRVGREKMKKLVLLIALSLFISGVAFGDIPPCSWGSGQKSINTTVKVQGLKNSKTANGSVLVLVVDPFSGHRTVTKIQNNVPISKGYKFNPARLFFVSAELLKEVGNNLNKIDFDNNENSSSTAKISKVDFTVDSTAVNHGLTDAGIEFPGVLCVDSNSSVSSQVITYTIK